MTMLVVLAIRVESDWVRQVLRSGRKAGSRVHNSVCSVQCALRSMQCASLGAEFKFSAVCIAGHSMQLVAVHTMQCIWVRSGREGDSTGSRSLVRQRGGWGGGGCCDKATRR